MAKPRPDIGGATKRKKTWTNPAKIKPVGVFKPFKGGSAAPKVIHMRSSKPSRSPATVTGETIRKPYGFETHSGVTDKPRPRVTPQSQLSPRARKQQAKWFKDVQRDPERAQDVRRSRRLLKRPPTASELLGIVRPDTARRVDRQANRIAAARQRRTERRTERYGLIGNDPRPAFRGSPTDAHHFQITADRPGLARIGQARIQYDAAKDIQRLLKLGRNPAVPLSRQRAAYTKLRTAYDYPISQTDLQESRKAVKEARGVTPEGKHFSTLNLGFAHLPTGAILNQTDKELRGVGALAAASKFINKRISIGADITGLHKAAPGRVLLNAIHDVYDLPAQAAPSLYLPGAAAVKAIGGDSSELKQMWQGYKDTGVLPSLFSGHFGTAINNLAEHPVYGALEVRGFKAGVGRGIGAGLRGVGKKVKVPEAPTRARSVLYYIDAVDRAPSFRQRLYAMADTARPDLKLYGGRKLTGRAYSKDFFSRAYQRAYERMDEKRGIDPHQARSGAAAYFTGRHMGRNLEHMVNARVAAWEHMRREGRSAGLAEVEAIMETDKPLAREAPQHLQLAPWIVKRIVRSKKTWREDLEHELARLEEVKGNPGRHGAPDGLHRSTHLDVNGNPVYKENAKLRDLHDATKEQIRQLLDDPDVDVDAAFRVAKNYDEWSRQTRTQLIDRGVLLPEQAEMAPLMPYAISHMGAEWTGTRRGGFLSVDGETPLTAQAIRDDMAANAPDLGPAPSPAPAAAVQPKAPVEIRPKPGEVVSPIFASLKGDIKNEGSTQFRPNSKPFRMNGERRFTPGRGFLTKDGRLFTWYEDEGTHNQRRTAYGIADKDTMADIHIRSDGTFNVSYVYGKADEFPDADIAQAVETLDPRLSWRQRQEGKPEMSAAPAPEDDVMKSLPEPAAKSLDSNEPRPTVRSTREWRDKRDALEAEAKALRGQAPVLRKQLSTREGVVKRASTALEKAGAYRLHAKADWDYPDGTGPLKDRQEWEIPEKVRKPFASWQKAVEQRDAVRAENETLNRRQQEIAEQAKAHREEGKKPLPEPEVEHRKPKSIEEIMDRTSKVELDPATNPAPPLEPRGGHPIEGEPQLKWTQHKEGGTQAAGGRTLHRAGDYEIEGRPIGFGGTSPERIWEIHWKGEPLRDEQGNLVTGSNLRESKKLVHDHAKDGVVEAQDRPQAEPVPAARDTLPDGEPTPEVAATTPEAEISAQEALRLFQDPGFIGESFHYGKGAFYVSMLRRGTRAQLSRGRRTGEAFRMGYAPTDAEMMLQEIVRTRGVMDAVDHFDNMVTDFSVKAPSGRYFSNFKQANNFRNSREGRRAAAALGDELVPVRVSDIGTARESMRRTKERQSPVEIGRSQSGVDQPFSQDFWKSRFNQMEESGSKAAEDSGAVVLMPNNVVRLIEAHLSPTSNPLTRTVERISSEFKGTVLPFSPRWFVGNVLDIYGLRAMASYGLVNPYEYFLGRRLLRDLAEQDPRAARLLRSMTVGGTISGQALDTAKRRVSTDFEGTTKHVVRKAEDFMQKPGVGSFGRMFRSVQRSLFAGNRWMESQPQYAALGRQARRMIHEQEGSYLKSIRLSKGAYEDVLKGLRNTPRQEAFGREIEKIFGTWSALSPTEKAAIITYVPFWSWVRNSARFVFVTLPRDHPVKVGILAAATQMSEEERKAMGLDWFVNENKQPPWRQGILPIGTGVRVQNYTSFGPYADPGTFLSSQVLPWAQGFLDTFSGQNWKNQPMKTPEGDDLNVDQKMGLGFYLTAEALIPLLRIARQGVEGGGKPYDTSTIFAPRTRPDTDKGFFPFLRAVGDPFRQISPGAAGKTGGSSGLGLGGSSGRKKSGGVGLGLGGGSGGSSSGGGLGF